MKVILMFAVVFVSVGAIASPWNCSMKNGASVMIDLKDNGQPTANGFTMHLLKEVSAKCSQFFAVEDASRKPLRLKGYLFEVCDEMLTSPGDFSALNCWQE